MDNRDNINEQMLEPNQQKKLQQTELTFIENGFIDNNTQIIFKFCIDNVQSL